MHSNVTSIPLNAIEGSKTQVGDGSPGEVTMVDVESEISHGKLC